MSRVEWEYRINYSFNCDSSNVVYLLECTVCGVQYVGSNCTPFSLISISISILSFLPMVAPQSRTALQGAMLKYTKKKYI